MDNYEEKYKAALGWMQSLYGELHGVTKEDAEHFGAGAQWADNNPADETIQRIVMLYKEWYTTESTMSMVDYIKQHLKS